MSPLDTNLTAAHAEVKAEIARTDNKTGLLLRAVRPNMSGAAVAGFPLWATLTAEEIRTRLADDQRGQDIANLSRIARAKFRRLQRAVDLVQAAGALLILAALIGIGGAV